MARHKKLTDQQIILGHRMRVFEEMSWMDIGMALGCSDNLISKECREMFGPDNKIRKSRRALYVNEPCDRRVERNPKFDPRRDGYPVYASVDAEITGSPPIGRRALDRKLVGTRTVSENR